MKKRRYEDILVCPRCLKKGKRITLSPYKLMTHELGEEIKVDFICPNKRKEDQGCGKIFSRILRGSLGKYSWDFTKKE